MNEKNTCQICARDIKAKKGIIAHHGYSRPGNGYQTRSCPGAKNLPYEVSCELIPPTIKAYEDYLVELNEQLNKLTAAPKSITRTRKDRLGNPTETIKHIRPEGYVYDASFNSRPNTYENALWHMVHEVEQNIKSMNWELEYLNKRLADWKPLRQA